MGLITGISYSKSEIVAKHSISIIMCCSKKKRIACVYWEEGLKFISCYEKHSPHKTWQWKSKDSMMHTHTVETCTLQSSGLSQDYLISPFSCFILNMRAAWPRCCLVCPFTLIINCQTTEYHLKESQAQLVCAVSTLGFCTLKRKATYTAVFLFLLHTYILSETVITKIWYWRSLGFCRENITLTHVFVHYTANRCPEETTSEGLMRSTCHIIIYTSTQFQSQQPNVYSATVSCIERLQLITSL